MPEEGDNAHGSPTPPTAVATTSAAPPPHTQAVKNRQRDPPLFAGSSDSDVHDWLKSYDRASQHNRWDDSFKLANVVFFLKETALQWFDNHEDEINSWDAFETRFADAFGKPEQRRQQAKQTLARRYQVNTESSLAYIEDVLKLCRRVDAHMPEEDRIRHLFKGLSQELFTIVAPKSPPTVQHLIDECKKYEELQSARINKEPFERLPEVCLAPAFNTDIKTMIRNIIRDELRPYLAHLQPCVDVAPQDPHVQSIQKVVQHEIRSALGHLSPPTPPPIAPPVAPLVCSMAHDPQPRYTRAPVYQVYPPTGSYGPRRRTDIWRTEDNRPICYNCQTPGHIARYCRRSADAAAYRHFPQGPSPYFHNESMPSGDRRARVSPSSLTTRRGRSPSPYPRRSRSVSPLNTVAAPTETSN